MRELDRLWEMVKDYGEVRQCLLWEHTYEYDDRGQYVKGPVPYTFDQIHYWDGINTVSIIQHFGSYGYSNNLLEVWDMQEEDGPIGHLTAEEAKEIIDRWYIPTGGSHV